MFSALPPHTSFAPLAERIVDQRVAALDRAHVDDRAQHHRALARVAQRQADGRAASLATKASATLRVDDDALGAHADLAGVGEGAEGRAVDRGIEVGIVQHDQRRLAAELQHRRLQVLRAGLRDQLADAWWSR